MLRRGGKWIAAVALLAACAAPRAPEPPAAEPSPAPPASASGVPAGVWAVRVTPLPARRGRMSSIIDPGEVSEIAASEAFAAQGWSPTRGARLSPRYRVDLLGDDGARASYWVGTGPQPPRFPCLASCNGWWIAPAGATREFNASRYKGLPESVSGPLLEALDIP